MAASSTLPQISVGSVVMSGDCIPFLSNLSGENESMIILGPGLRRTVDTVTATKSGMLKKGSGPNVYWVDSHQRRYVAERGDDVIGIVTQRAGDSYRVDIGTNENASISFLAFEGSSQKNRPHLQIGDLVYAKLLLASKDMEPELVCVDSYGKSKGLLGLLTGGFMFQVPLHLIRKLRSPGFDVERALSKLGTFEIALGMNGRVWIKGRSAKETIGLANALSLLEYTKNTEIESTVEQIVNAMSTF